MRVPGITAEIRGDYSQLKQDMAGARRVVRDGATDMSDALANALSPQQISRAVNGLVATLNTAKNHAKLTGKGFNDLGGELKQLSSLTGFSEKDFAKLHARMLQTRAAKEQEKAFQALERQLGLTRAESARMRYQLGDLSGASRQYLGIMNDRVHSVTQRIFSLKAALAGLGIAYVMRDTLQTAASFETLQISLETVTGSSLAAKQAMSWIEDFTQKTPYELEQVADAFRKLAAYGMEPAKYLGTLGDTAAAMGKTLDMAVEAFADAARGEFERLKEFGVKAKTEGDRVTFSWVENGRRLTKEVVKNEIAISNALAQIWSRYKGGMQRQMDTWNGLWSNLLDQWSMFQREVMDSGPLLEMKRQLKEFLEYLGTAEGQNTLRDWAKSTGEGIKSVVTGLESLLTALGRLKEIWDGIPTPLKGMLIGGAVGGVVGRHPYAAAGGAIMGLGAGLAEWSNEKSGGHKPSRPLTLQDFGLPSDADFNQIYAKVQELEVKAKELQARADQFWQDVQNTTAPGTEDRDEKFEQYKKMLRHVAEFQAQLQQLLRMEAGHSSGTVKPTKEEINEVADAVLKARQKLAEQIELIGLDSHEKALKRLEQEKAKHLKATKDKELVERWYNAKKTELAEAAAQKLTKLEQQHADELLSLAQQTEDAQTAAAKAGITDREQLAALDYQDRMRQLDRWLADEQRKIERQLADLARSHEGSDKERQAQAEYLQDRLIAIEKLGAAKRFQIEQEYNEKRKSEFQKLMEEWADLTRGWDQIAKDFMTGVQSSLFNAFKGAFENVGSAWDSLWEGMKNIAYQVIAAIATRLATGFIAKIVLNVTGSGGGGSVLSGLFDSGGGFNTNMFSGASNWIGMGGLGAGAADMMNGYAGSLYAFNEGAGMAGNAMGASSAGSALGGVAGIAGALYSAYNLYQLYQNGPGGMEGAAQGAMTGAMGGMAAGMAYGAMTGSSIGPWGAIIGALIGALAGGLGGGGGDAEDRMKDAEDFQERARRILAGKGTQEDYMEAIKSGHRSDNRVSGQAMEELYLASKQKGLLEWWAPAPGQMGYEPRREYSPEEWKRYQVYGGTEEGEMGSLAFMELFGGAGKGGWQGADQADIQKAMEGLSEETIDKLGSSLTTFKDLATEWGVSIQDLLGPLINADLAGEDWKEALEGLSAATLVQNAADAERERGLNELAIAQNSVMRSISLMAGWNDMEADGKKELIAQLQKDAGRRDELMQASERLQEVENQLTGSHKLSEEEVAALAQEYADLTEKLGLNDTAAADAATAASDFADVMMDEVIPALREALQLGGGDGDEHHHGGLIYHSGGMVGAMLHAGMITAHGGSPRMHSGGLRPDERMTILQAGEFVVQRSSVNAKTLEALRNINATGRLPVDMLSRAMDQIGNTPKFHSGGPVTPLPAMASTARPQGGDGGQAVVINFNPQITVNAENGADAAKIEAAVTKALEKSRVALKRQLEQTGYQVVDAQ